MKTINLYTPVYHRFIKTKKSIESIIESIKSSTNDVMLHIGVNGVEGGKNSMMEDWLKSLANNNKVRLFFGQKNYGKAVMINYMANNSRESEYTISIDSDMIAKKHKKFNWIDELVKLMESPLYNEFGLLSSWQEENNCHMLKNLPYNYEFLNHKILFGQSGYGIAGGCIILKTKDFNDIGKYKEYDLYTGDDAFLMHKTRDILKKKAGVVETIKLVHPYNDTEEKEYQQWKLDKSSGKLPIGLNTKGFYD